MSQQVGQFIIKLGADNAELISQMEVAKKRVRDYGKDAKKAADNNQKLAKGFQEAANNASIFLGPLNSVSGHLSSVSAGISRVGAAQLAMTTAITGTLFTLKKSLDVYERWETTQLVNEQLLRSTGNAAGISAKELDKMAHSVALNTLASVEGVQAAQAKMLTFRSVHTEVFTRAIGLSQDLAQVMKQDVSAGALQLGKALEDPIQGITALSRVGVTFSEAQKEQIKGFAETNQLTKAQTVILDVLAAQMGGSGVAAAQGLSGAWDTLGQKWDELLNSIAKESSLGQATTTLVTDAANALGFVDTLFGSATPEEELKELEARKAAYEARLNKWRAELQQLPDNEQQDTKKGQHLQRNIKDVEDLIYGYERLDDKGQQWANSLHANELRLKTFTEGTKDYAAQLEKIRVIKKQLANSKTESAPGFDGEIDKLKAHLAAEDAVVQQQDAKHKATQAALDAERQQAFDAANQAMLEKEQEAGLRKLQAFDSSLLSQEEKARASYDRRLIDLEGMTLAEGEIARRGFDNIGELRTYYNEMARQQMLGQLDAIVERDAKELERETSKQEALAASRSEASEVLATWYEQQQELLNNHHITEAELEAGHFETQLEARAYYEEMLRLSYDERLAFIEEHNQREIDAEASKWQRMNKTQKALGKQRETMEQGIANKSLNILASSTKEGSGIWMAAILGQQAMMASQAIMKAQLLATDTTAAMMPAPGTDPFGARVAAATAAGESIRGWGMINAALIMAQGVGQIAGAREFGGPVLGGYNYLVGENGPEVVSFGSSGTVHPNKSLDSFGGGGMTVYITQTIDARGADDGAEARMLAAGDKLIDAAYERVLSDAKSSGPIRRELGL